MNIQILKNPTFSYYIVYLLIRNVIFIGSKPDHGWWIEVVTDWDGYAQGHQMRWDAMRWNEIWDVMRCNEMHEAILHARCDSACEMRCKMRCDSARELRCDEVRWDVMRCDAKRCDPRWDAIQDVMQYKIWSLTGAGAYCPVIGGWNLARATGGLGAGINLDQLHYS